ncbi:MULTISPECIES: chemotaxis response regulator protein-glutamate methylesterase [unclassified Bradyrhizobium]|uniref:protein-glutamate methylesterase/protein-glutamine glutaminase n=1 Tax=unclassified Bradyrhizobium TaxID=2631580 RepID=UPI001CD66A8B|nr:MULTISPECIES: chemotaxis response regulator protein-glutamate methylesterase [unclassified Bradyrhizobium]MCA1376325.1 chemotaxis response regulator protein-glutamate methylesterase [Bradyrhizobium sp. IC4060]MCA1489105.1 chemotaxis response regulator protein-glutamate methylesterase [Bradyrhizobium sp. IC4061]MCA1502118.1 chemotaxis response regulator protein-glutamate methylesterase [Bradyrhizobium sp. NBAIM14]MCA1512528.1 chemotaxis response regulator protein-glutamate methylesterase [Bra
MSVAFAGNSTTSTSRETGPLRVMIVDDSVVIRGLISRWIGAEHDMEVAASLRTGLEAVNQLDRINPDVAVLDIEMPELDGLSALPQLLAKKRDLVIIMASTLTRRNAEISFKALSLGAADYIPKPESTREASAADIFHHDLIQKIRHLGARLRRKSAVASPPLAPASPAPVARSPVARPAAPAPAPAPSSGSVSTRPFSTQAPKVLLIGSSTGGPQALMSLVTELSAVIDRFPVLITQHMPPTFTTILAEHLARSSRRPAAEAVDGEPVKPGRIYLAPGGKHMRVTRSGADPVIALDDGPAVNFCKPAVDPLFTSAIDVWHGNILSVILTGMGSDGMRGGKDIVAAGGSVIAQDEASSVVWGMPGAAANAGICAAILPLNQIGAKVNRLFAGDRS